MPDGAYIRDVRSLEELSNIISFTGETMSTIEENVSNYLDGVKDVLGKQLEIIREKLEEYKEILREAQEALSSCEDSQEYDEDTGEYTPSCQYEARAVDAAQADVDEWQKKYDTGKDIADECQSEINDYNFPGGIVMPPGGHHLIRYMCEQQTPKATQQLQEYINDIYEYKHHDVGGDPDTIHEITNPAVQEEDKPMTEDDKLAAFKNKIQGIKDEQEETSYSYKIKDANRVMRCPDCGKPLQLCTCRNIHVDVNLYQ